MLKKLPSIIRRKVSPDNADISLYLSIVDQARNFIENSYPDSEFHIIFWDIKNSKLSDNLINFFLNQHFLS
jgi:hypothetical protein